MTAMQPTADRSWVRHRSFELDFGHDRVLDLVELPFEVPAQAEAVRVRYEVAPRGPGPCTVDLGLVDPGGVRGWSGSERKEVFVRAESATPGYRTGPLREGRWAVLLGLYELPSEGCRAKVEVEVELRHRQWLAGDLHVHTHHSDGRFSVPDVADRALAAGLDWVALADHNTTSQNREPASGRPVLLVPAMEWTSYRGHACLIGAAEPVDDFRWASRDDVARILQQARGRGAFIDLAHPMERMCASCAWRWGFDLPFDGVEVWNGPWRPTNAEALAWWQAELAAGRRLVGVGGSDFHRPDDVVRLGEPVNWVLAEGRDVPAVLEAIARGRVSVGRSAKDPAVFLRCGEALQGSRISPEDLRRHGVEVASVRGSALPEGRWEIRVVSAAGVVWSWRTGGAGPAAGGGNGGVGAVVARLDGQGALRPVAERPGTHRFLRAELWEPETATSPDGPGRPVCLTNPLWLV